MKTLEELIEDYLLQRRALGYKLRRHGLLLPQFAAFQSSNANTGITTKDAVTWARSAQGTDRWHAQRLSIVRQFARWANAFDPSFEIPPHRLIPSSPTRAVPYIYTTEQIGALMGQAQAMDSAFVAETYQTLIGLLACTGLRVGEAIRANTGDLNDGLLSIIDTKFGKSRLVPVHPSTTAALTEYRHRVEQEFGASLACEALLVSEAGTRLIYANVQQKFARLTAQAGILPRSSRCRPRPHDLRHTFATNTLLDAYLTGKNPLEILPILATYLGHVSPASTYWYLEATPELLEAAGGKIPPLEMDTDEGEDDD